MTLFALPGSHTSARLESPVPESYSENPGIWDWQLYESWQVAQAFRRARDFDIIHCHSYHFGLMYCDFVATPSLHTLHVEPGPDLHFLAQRTRNRHLHFVSRFQARDFHDVAGVSVIPHGIDMDEFRVAGEQEREDYLAFLGRLHPDKGPAEAIAIARRAGVPLKLAAPENDYYREVIAPLVDSSQVQYVGELAPPERAAFLSRARAMLYPIQRGEAFGLVLAEAMASGLPVIAYAVGTVPEIVEHGVTGWLGQTERDLVEGIGHVARFNRESIRRRAEQLYSVTRMVDDLEALMQSLAAGGAR